VEGELECRAKLLLCSHWHSLSEAANQWLGTSTSRGHILRRCRALPLSSGRAISNLDGRRSLTCRGICNGEFENPLNVVRCHSPAVSEVMTGGT
jgi:hypothetical protein